MSLAQILLTTGISGSGKSYSCVRRFVDQMLPSWDGVLYTNFPLHVAPIAEYVALKRNCDPQEVADRIHLLPDDVEEDWIAGRSGPWEYFAGVDLTSAHLAIDECHKHCGKGHPLAHRKRWAEWIGEIRHQNCTVEFVTQHISKLAGEVENEAGLRLQISNAETDRDPFFNIQLKYWYELIAKFFTGRYIASVWQVEKREEDGRWIDQERHKWRILPYYFKFYDSYSRPLGSASSVKSAAQQREFQKRNHLSLLWWFFEANVEKILLRGAAFGLFVWLFAFGGAKATMIHFKESIQERVASNAPDPEVNTLAATSTENLDETAVFPSRANPRKEVPPEVITAERDRLLQVTQNLQRQLHEKETALVNASNRAEILVNQRDLYKQEIDDASQLRLIAPTFFLTEEGERYEVGDELETGPHRGRTVERIDHANRKIYLSDAVVLRFSPRLSSRNPETSGTGFSRLLGPVREAP